MNQVETLLNMLFLYPSESFTKPRYDKEILLEYVSENLEEFYDFPMGIIERLLPSFFNKVSDSGDNNLENLLNDLDLWMEEYKYVQTEYQENEYNLVFDNFIHSVLNKINELFVRCDEAYK